MDLKEHLIRSVEDAENNISKIDNYIIETSRREEIKSKHLYNNIASFYDARYLEIGCHNANTAALCDNNMRLYICINNWSEFKKNKDDFLYNFYAYKENNNAYFIDKDCFKLDKTIFKNKFNIYHLNNSNECFYKKLQYYYDFLDNIFILIADCSNLKIIRAIHYLNLKIIHEIRLKEMNGLFLAVLQK